MEELPGVPHLEAHELASLYLFGARVAVTLRAELTHLRSAASVRSSGRPGCYLWATALYENFCPPTDASYIKPPFAIVTTPALRATAVA